MDHRTTTSEMVAQAFSLGPFSAQGHRLKACATRTAPGAVLLEVVLALALLVLASGVILGALGSCSQAAGRLHVRARAADLAVTMASRLQMGLVQPDQTNATAFEEPDLGDWTWQVHVEPLSAGDAPLQRVQVIVRHTPTGIFRQAAQLLPIERGTAP